LSFFIYDSAGVFSLLLKETAFHEMKNQSSPRADIVEESRKPKTMNNGSKPLAENLFYVRNS
jgi:hypothetical protein